MKIPFQPGDQVTTHFYPINKNRPRTVIRCYRSIDCPSGWLVDTKDASGKTLKALDAKWYTPVGESLINSTAIWGWWRSSRLVLHSRHRNKILCHKDSFFYVSEKNNSHENQWIIMNRSCWVWVSKDSHKSIKDTFSRYNLTHGITSRMTQQ